MRLLAVYRYLNRQMTVLRIKQRVERNLLIVFFSLGLVVFPATGFAQTLGDISVDSYLGEKLSADISLNNVNHTTIQNLTFRLASQSAYKRAGLNYDAVLRDIHFEVKKRLNYDLWYLRVTSSAPVTTSKLILMIEASLASTRMHRRYHLQFFTKLAIPGSKETYVVMQRPEAILDAPPAAGVEREIMHRDRKVMAKPGIAPKVPEHKPAAAPQKPMIMSERAEAPAVQMQTEKNTQETSKSISKSVSKAVSATKVLDEYYVDLRGDQEITRPGKPAELVVWIGAEEFKPDMVEGMAHANTAIPAIGQTAKVEPYARMFDIEPKERCLRVHPTGSEATFTLTPRDTGSYEVGATVHMYESGDCSGTPVPKTVRKLNIEVRVGTEEILESHMLQLWNKFWEGFLDFWGWAVATFFALLMFLIRKKLKRIFGFVEQT